MKVLLVDDNKDSLDDLERAVNSFYREVTIVKAKDGQEAIELYRASNDFDLVLTDIMMHPAGGFGLTAEIYGSESLNKAPVVYVSGTWADDYLGRMFVEHIPDDFPVSFCSKRFWFKDETEFADVLGRRISEAQGKFGGNSGRQYDTAPLKRIEERLQSDLHSHLATYLSKRFAEFLKPLAEYELKLESKGGSAELFRRVLNQVRTCAIPDQDIVQYCHELGQIGPCFSGGELYGDIPSARKEVADAIGEDAIRDIEYRILKVLEARSEVLRMTSRYSPREDSIGLITARWRNKRDLPLTYPAKIRSVELMKEKGIIRVPEHRVLRPEDSMDTALGYYGELSAGGRAVIVRSAHRFEGNSIYPFAGHFDSVQGVTNQGEFAEAVKHVRDTETSFSYKGRSYCLAHGFKEPSRKDMYILLMVDTMAKYEGSMLEHPNHEGVFIFEIHTRKYKDSHEEPVTSYFLYDANKDKIIPDIGNCNVPFQEHKCLSLVRELVTDYRKMTDGTEYSPGDSHRMEFGCNDDLIPSQYQFTRFRKKVNAGSFDVEDARPYRCIGKTPPEGIELVVLDESSFLRTAALANEILQEGKLPCIVLKNNVDPNTATFWERTGLVISGKDFAVLSHDYFNPFYVADNVLMLERGELEELKIEGGMVLRYTSNGINWRLDKVTDYEPIMRRVDSILNQ
ncbi:MAG: response regulator [Nanoarchaeota archaeon]|nr:response regulator [Nanoarchaeota archaeon]